MKTVQILKGQPFMTEYGIVGYSTVVLVQDEGRNILYDCGQRGCALQLKEGLRKCGLGPENIDTVVISHLHFDHVGNLPLFEHAELLFSETEWEEALTHPDEWTSIQTCTYIKQRGGFRFVHEGEKLTDAVQVRALGGHTRGLIGLLCGGDTVLCSDAIKNRYEMWNGVKPMTVDPKMSRATMERIRSLARYVYPGHDAMLETAHPEKTEPVQFELRLADGRRMPIKA